MSAIMPMLTSMVTQHCGNKAATGYEECVAAENRSYIKQLEGKVVEMSALYGTEKSERYADNVGISTYKDIMNSEIRPLRERVNVLERESAVNEANLNGYKNEVAAEFRCMGKTIKEVNRSLSDRIAAMQELDDYKYMQGEQLLPKSKICWKSGCSKGCNEED